MMFLAEPLDAFQDEVASARVDQTADALWHWMRATTGGERGSRIEAGAAFDK